MNDEQSQHVHDLMTRGHQLTPEEQSELEAWYARQDQSEAQLLSQSTLSASPVDLQQQVATVAAQLEIATQHIRELMAENLLLRHEVTSLQHQLAQLANKAA